VDSGLLSNRMIFGHFIHTDAYIINQTGHAGAAMSWNPLSNGRLASGVADIPAYLKAGIRVGMGVDGEASADLADPFENLRTGLYAIRDKYESAAIMSPYDVLRLHTLGSADVLGVADRLGSLEAGKLADFLVIDPSHFGHIFDPYATLVFVTSEPDLERVYVGGELLVERGKLLKHDFAKIQMEVDKRVNASLLAPN
jgi:5-methylthioadenosine/S-adenosylhomocysteine deaminase